MQRLQAGLASSHYHYEVCKYTIMSVAFVVIAVVYMETHIRTLILRILHIWQP